MSKTFQLHSPFQPTGDQPKSIEKIVSGLKKNMRHQTILGATGTGKTFVMANIIAEHKKPALVIAHNKTLAAQLASEFRTFFPKNAVHYFVSYYDYYQPEAYIPRSDTYIEKETELNEEIDRLRHASTQALLSRDDVIIVASVSCIYGLGSPAEYKNISLTIERAKKQKRATILRKLIIMQYQRNDINFLRGTFRIRGDALEIYPSASDQNAYRIEFWGEEIEKITEIDTLTGEKIQNWDNVDIYPATHYVAPEKDRKIVLAQIQKDLHEQVTLFKQQNKLLEAQRIEQRTKFDLEMIEQVGYVNGIENYSRYFDRRKKDEPPFTLLDYFPEGSLTFIDESHITIPQIRGMYAGDRSRKEILVNYGFRLPAALDNRPLNFSEFEKRVGKTIYVSATPQEYELTRSKTTAVPSGQTVELLIRPTGLLDPKIAIRPTPHQIDDLMNEIQKRVNKAQRTLITTLTKRLAEELTEYLKEAGIKVQYLHSEIDTMERLEILRDLRLGIFDVVVGINLLREGLDLPEVSLVAILDADKEGFLRSRTSLIQTIGRAARHVEGLVIMYADKITDSMKAAINETNRRRAIQKKYNTKHGITPESIKKAVKEERLAGSKKRAEVDKEAINKEIMHLSDAELTVHMKDLEEKMELAARNLDFEEAAKRRDEIILLTKNKERLKKNDKKRS